jgi:hypothetical protein
MSDFVNCPTCHGRGVVPLATAESMHAHGQAALAEAAAEHRRVGMPPPPRPSDAEIERRFADLERRAAASDPDAA